MAFATNNPDMMNNKIYKNNNRKKVFYCKILQNQRKIKMQFSIFVFVFFICIIMIMNDFFFRFDLKNLANFFFCVFWLFSAIVDDFCIFQEFIFCHRFFSQANSDGYKGQLISECLFGVIDFPKNNEKFEKFLPQNLKSGEINKVKALHYIII